MCSITLTELYLISKSAVLNDLTDDAGLKYLHVLIKKNEFLTKPKIWVFSKAQKPHHTKKNIFISFRKEKAYKKQISRLKIKIIKIT